MLKSAAEELGEKVASESTVSSEVVKEYEQKAMEGKRNSEEKKYT